LPARSSEFDKCLQSAIDDALLSLGDSVRQAIYFHIEKSFNVPKDSISEELEQFQAGLEKIFGIGARFLEILIMKNLHAKLGLPLEINGTELDLINYINAARDAYSEKKTITMIPATEEIDLCQE
jgi:hypothetical protein